MNESLGVAWTRINSLVANPYAALFTLAFIIGWFVGSIRGYFDPGMTIGGFVTNALQTFLLFVAASAATQAHSSAKAAHRSAMNASLHAKAGADHAKRALSHVREHLP